jgi:hypothetical protein
MNDELPLEPLELPVALPLNLPDILETLAQQTLEGGTLVTGPTADANRDSLTALGFDVREQSERLLESLREMQRLAGNA